MKPDINYRYVEETIFHGIKNIKNRNPWKCLHLIHKGFLQVRVRTSSLLAYYWGRLQFLEDLRFVAGHIDYDTGTFTLLSKERWETAWHLELGRSRPTFWLCHLALVLLCVERVSQSFSFLLWKVVPLHRGNARLKCDNECQSPLAIALYRDLH